MFAGHLYASIMSQILNIELSESTFAVIQQRAEAVGTSPANFVEELLEEQFRSKTLSEIENQLARERFESHFGEVNLGCPTGADNDSIDKDLASAYADTHTNKKI